MSKSAKERQRLSRANRSPVLGVPGKVKRFLLAHPEQAPVVDAFMVKLAQQVKRDKSVTTKRPTWESEHPNGLATIDGNEDSLVD